MAAPPPNPAVTSHILSSQRALLDTLSSFLTVCTHHILYLRRIYPPVSFLSTRAYNYPVRQNRHPAVCHWINDAISAIRDQLAKNTVSFVSLCIHELETNQVLERWTFDLHTLPSVAKRDRDVPFALADDQPQGHPDSDLPHKVNLTDLEATFRATLSRITTSSARLKPLPEGDSAPELTFTLTIELRPNADRPVGRIEAEERKWIVAEPDADLEPIPTDNATPGSSDSTATVPQKTGKTHPIRRLDASPLHIELWVEESAHKLNCSYPTPSQRDAATRAAEVSYGVGTEKFNPAQGYDDLEPPDVNRKPGGGAMTDYQRM